MLEIDADWQTERFEPTESRRECTGASELDSAAYSLARAQANTIDPGFWDALSSAVDSGASNLRVAGTDRRNLVQQRKIVSRDNVWSLLLRN